jgi:hypothetical protein
VKLLLTNGSAAASVVDHGVSDGCWFVAFFVRKLCA